MFRYLSFVSLGISLFFVLSCGKTVTRTEGLAFSLQARTIFVNSNQGNDFGPVLIGQSKQVVFTLNNDSRKEAYGISFGAFPEGFGFSGGAFPGLKGNCTRSMGSKDSCTVEIEFRPLKEGIVTGSVAISYFQGKRKRALYLFLTGRGGLPPTPVPVDIIKIGDTSTGALPDNENGNLLLAQQVLLNQNATIQSLSFYVTTTGGNLRLGIYSNQNGSPSQLLAATPEFLPVTGWNTVNVTTQVRLSAGTYWLAYHPQSNSLGFRKTDSGPVSKYTAYTYGTLPNVFPGNLSTTPSHWSFYATLGTIIPVPSPTPTPSPVVMAPEAPSNLMAAAISTSQINLSWMDNSSNEMGFKIQRSTDGVNFSDLISLGSNVVSYSNAALPSGTRYYYRVLAYNSGGSSAYSAVANATTLVPPMPSPTPTPVVMAPVAPSGLAAVPISTSQVNLSWVDNSDNEMGFRIQRSSDGANFSDLVTLGVGVVSYSNAGLLSGTRYYYRVLAFNTGGASAYSAVANATTLVPPTPTPTPTPSPSPVAVPLAPSGLAASAVSASQINLSWIDNSTNETGFRIQRSGDGINFTDLVSLAAGAVTYSNTSISASTRYYYRVQAFNTGGASSYSNTANATTLPTAPVAPSGLVAAPVSASQITLTWADNSTNETGFRIQRSGDGINFTDLVSVGAGVVSYSNTGLSASTQYTYRVQAFNAGGASSYSNAANATTLPMAPQAPSGLMAAAISTSQINLSWVDNSANEAGFKLQRSPDGVSFADIATLGANIASYSNTGLQSGVRYYYRVSAYNAGGSSSYSAAANATTLIPPTPTPTPTPSPTPPPTLPKRSYDVDIKPIMQAHCTGCHSTAAKFSGLALDTYRQADYAGGDLFTRWNNALTRMSNQTMPPGTPKASASQVQIMTEWIAQGMPEFPPMTTPTPTPTSTATPTPTPSPVTIGPTTAFKMSQTIPKTKLRRVTKYEYQAAVTKLTGIAPNIASLAEEVLYLNLPTEATVLKLGGVNEANALFTIATNIALAANVATIIPCDLTNCTSTQVGAFLRRAFNKEPTSQDVTDFTFVYTDAKAAKDHDFGKRALLQAALISTSFLYRTEIGAGTKLTAKELAAKLASFLWGEPPDATLLAAADNGSILNATTYAQQVDRMLADPKAGNQLARFINYYLGLSDYDINSKNLVANFPAGTQTAMVTEVKMLVTDILFTQRQSLAALLLSNYTYMNNLNAPLYGVSVTGSTFQKINLNTSQRMGVLTTPLVLSAHAKSIGRSPMQRGHFIVRDLLCLNFPPEAGTPVMTLPSTSGLTLRQQFAQVETKVPCSYCHQSLNGGFAFDQFDVFGQKVASTVVPDGDTAGILNLPGDPALSFMGPVQAVQTFARHRETERCFTSQLYRFAQGRYPGSLDVNVMTDLQQGIDGSVLTLMRILALSNEFIGN